MSKSDEMFAPVGSLVFCSYWGTVDLVLEHRDTSFGPSVVVVQVDHPASRVRTSSIGRYPIRTHGTPLDRRDRIVGTVEPSVVAGYLA